MHEVFEEEDMQQIFRWLDKFIQNPYTDDDQLVPAGDRYPVLGVMSCVVHSQTVDDSMHDYAILTVLAVGLYCVSVHAPKVVDGNKSTIKFKHVQALGLRFQQMTTVMLLCKVAPCSRESNLMSLIA